jgi:hypothetical protein
VALIAPAYLWPSIESASAKVRERPESIVSNTSGLAPRTTSIGTVQPVATTAVSRCLPSTSLPSASKMMPWPLRVQRPLAMSWP